jgi:hypothetical protein
MSMRLLHGVDCPQLTVERRRPERHAFELDRHAKLSYSRPTSIPDNLSDFRLPFVALATIRLAARRKGAFVNSCKQTLTGLGARGTLAVLFVGAVQGRKAAASSCRCRFRLATVQLG